MHLFLKSKAKRVIYKVLIAILIWRIFLPSGMTPLIAVAAYLIVAMACTFCTNDRKVEATDYVPLGSGK